MLIRKFLFFSLISVFCINLNAQNNFEGNIKFKITSDDNSVDMNYFLKEGKFRIEMGEKGENAVFINANGKSLILMPEQKMYMDLNNSMFAKMKEMMGNKDEDENEEKNEKDFDINKYRTGKTKTILGYECEQWIFNDMEDDEQDQVEAWVTDELGNFMLMENPMGSGFSPGWGGSFKDKGFFPLLVITKDSDGEEVSRFEATEVNKKSLNDDLFQAPSDYSEMKVPGM